MDNTSFYSRYASLILRDSLGAKEGDVLSINTEEEDYAFARIVAREAKRITGNGSYIQLLKNGRVTEEFDILSDFPLTKQPTLFLYLSYYRESGNVNTDENYEAKDYQRFSLLSDPIDNPLPSFPAVKCILPSPVWDRMLEEAETERDSRRILESILSLEEDGFIENAVMRHENLLYKAKALNSMNLTKGYITSDEGTDLEFSFLPGSVFVPSYSRTTDGRFFSPSVTDNDILRLLDPSSMEGWLNITRPIVLWGRVIRNLSLHFSQGRVDEVRGTREAESLFSFYASKESDAARASMLTLAEDTHPLADEELTLISEFDRMRTVSVTIGGPRGEAVDENTAGKTVDSLLTLTLPVGSDSLTITCLDGEGDERTVFSDGSINED